METDDLVAAVVDMDPSGRRQAVWWSFCMVMVLVCGVLEEEGVGVEGVQLV